MKTRRKELDVDFMGSQEPLTSSEEKLLNEYFSKKKEHKSKGLTKTKRISHKEKSTV